MIVVNESTASQVLAMGGWSEADGLQLAAKQKLIHWGGQVFFMARSRTSKAGLPMFKDDNESGRTNTVVQIGLGCFTSKQFQRTGVLRDVSGLRFIAG